MAGESSGLDVNPFASFLGQATRIGSIILAAALFALSGCGGESPTALVERLIPDDPEILLDPASLFDSETVFSWSFASQQDVAAWQIEGVTSSSLNPSRWHLESSSGKAQLTRPLDLEASELHEIKVTLTGLQGGKAKLFWAGAGQGFSADRSITLDAPFEKARREATLSFDLAAHPRWGGHIERLRLNPTDAPSDIIEMQSMTGRRRTIRATELASALGRAWKIDLDAEVRNVRLAAPGIAIEHLLNIEQNQQLRFSYGLEATIQEDVEFRISGTPAAPAAVEPQESQLLWSNTLAPQSDADRWHQGALDLSAFAGQQLTLKLETMTSNTPDLARGFPVWGNPEIIGPATAESPPNVILISLDTLRSDRLSAYGHSRPTSPNLDRWAAKSAVLFENAVVQAPWTLPSHASMFTGLEAMRHDVNHFGEAPESLEMLAETLRREGYRTGAITGGGYLRPQFGFAQGFDFFRYWPQILAEQEFEEGTKRLFEWLDTNRSQPFFLLFHTYEIHFPHRKRQPYFDRLQDGEPEGQIRGEIGLRARPQPPGEPLWQHDYFVVTLPSGEEVEHLNDDEKELMFTMYDSAIRYVDEQMGALFKRLEELDLKGRTLIVVTSDHGEAMGEQNRGGHNYHGDYNVMVPLIIEFPDGFGAGKRIDQQVRSIDIVPTVLETLGISRPRPMDGASLRALVDGNSDAVPPEAWTYASSANYGLGLRYRNQLKYVFNNTAWSSNLGDEEIYDLSTDPHELSNQAASHPSKERLLAKAQEAIEQQHEGLRLRIRNGGDGVLSGRLGHSWAHHNRVKAADPSCECLTWSAGRIARFSLQPGQATTLFFESIPGPIVGLQGRLELPGEQPAEFNEIFDLRKIGQIDGLEHTADGWLRRAPKTEKDSGVEVGFTLWRPTEGAGLRAEGREDQEVLDQLKALGYVNP